MHLCNNNSPKHIQLAVYDHKCDDQQISIDWQSNLWHCSIWNIYLIHLSICIVAVKRIQLKVGQSLHPTQHCGKQQYSTFLILSCSTLKFFCHLTNLIPTLHSFQTTTSVWCNGKTTRYQHNGYRRRTTQRQQDKRQRKWLPPFFRQSWLKKEG